MKKNVHLPEIPSGIDENHHRFYTEVLEELETLRRETVEAIAANLIKQADDDADYTLGDMQYNTFEFTGLTADRDFNLPSYVGYEGYEFEIINLSDYTVVITPDGTEDINDWNSTFEITEKYGRVRVMALSDRWLVTPLNDACIYEVSTETADTGLALDGTWDDVSGMALLNGIYGEGLLSAKVIHYIADSSNPASLASYFGIGKTSGDNAPDIPGLYDFVNEQQVISNTNEQYILTRQINNIEYESDGSTIYMKLRGTSDELNITTHAAYGATNCPMYIKWIRTK